MVLGHLGALTRGRAQRFAEALVVVVLGGAGVVIILFVHQKVEVQAIRSIAPEVVQIGAVALFLIGSLVRRVRRFLARFLVPLGVTRSRMAIVVLVMGVIAVGTAFLFSSS